MLPKMPEGTITLPQHTQASPKSAAQRTEVGSLRQHGRNRMQRIEVMARARVSHDSVTAEVRDDRKREDVSIFPIAIPLLTGQWYN
ncbi:MAG: hypothetical protein C4B59_16550 [Candidatus Methanogaster sp.]|uniref:Uncharacterized protein n=1 Tax=Candidatus Methanogaster sp. TaxID=3386292 RepID=A0AC61KY49_9EURY|nr:MAG: hypothetical protein C4B59_16550 [ANME-2 cluster archaeon]